MRRAFATALGIAFATLLGAATSTHAARPRVAQGTQGTQGTHGENAMVHHAKGTFEPKVTQAAADDKADGSTLGRWTLAKTIHGDLEGTSEGEMLTAGTDVKGSAGYVAMERVTGTLNGRRGSFILQHSGTMSHGAFQLSVTVVPDSGSGELKGIAGTMKIRIGADGKHSYEFDYTLPTE